jgi:hypothetical protein
MSWHHAILAEEFAEPSTFTTHAHQQAVRALVSGATKALARDPSPAPPRR